ncbi:unnamed protein product [Sphagnum compactum]
MRIFDMMKKKVIGGGSGSNNDGHVNVVVSSAAGEEDQGCEFKGFRVGVDPVMWDLNSRSHHGTSSHRLLCQLNGSLDGPSSVTTLRECTSHEGSAHYSNGTTPPHKAKANGTIIHNNNNNHGCCSPKVLKVLGADEYEEDKILSYIKERTSNERWSSSSSASSASSVDSEISEQSTIWSPGGEQLPTERPLFCNKLSTTPQALLGAALTPEGRDPCSQIGMIRMCNHSSHPPCRNGVQPLTCLKSEPILSDNVVLNLNERRSPTPSALLSPCIKSEDSTGTGKGTPWEMSGSSTPQRHPKELLSPVLPSTTTSLHERVYHQPHKLPTPPHSPSCEQPAQSCSSSSHGTGAGMRLRVTAAADRMQSNQGLELPPMPSHFSSSSHSLSQSPYHSTNYSSPQGSPPYLSPLQSPSHSPVARPLRRWRKGQQLGKGSFGTVYEGWNLDDGSFFAVKVIDSEAIAPEIQQEVTILSRLRHPHIVQYYGSTIEDGCLYIFLELVKMGSLQSLLKNFQVFDEGIISTYTHQILKGLEYLHNKNTIHRDVKCANVLVDSNGQVKLADFGLAKQMNKSLATSFKGTPFYMAPEVCGLLCMNNRAYGVAVDIWSLGCTVIEMAQGKPPWSELGVWGFFFKVTKGELPPIPQHLKNETKDFIQQCLRVKPEDRPSARELLEHPFVAHAPPRPTFAAAASASGLQADSLRFWYACTVAREEAHIRGAPAG